MTDTTLQQAAPASKFSRKRALRVFLWTFVLVVFSVAWFILLAIGAPARLDFSSVGAFLMASTPPVLLTLVCWTGVQWSSTPRRRSAPATDAKAPTVPSEPTMPVARFRIGAWSALTPHGKASETVEGTKARNKVFKPDKAILHASGYPAHAGIIDNLNLEAMGHPADTRLRAPRVMTMLGAILDDLHLQQPTVAASIEGPASVYWLVPPALIAGDDAHSAIFEGAWKRSVWRAGSYRLHMIPASDACVFTVLLNLQNEIDQSTNSYAMIVAADSLLDREELARSLALRHVFSHTALQGFVPSEGGGGVLLFNPEATPDDLWADAAILGPVQTSVRNRDESGLRGVMSGALTAAGKSAVDIGIVVSNSNYRTRGGMEVIGVMAHVLAGLDPLEQRISPMEYAGAFGAATDIVHLALAVELAGEKSVLAISSTHGLLAAVVVIPS